MRRSRGILVGTITLTCRYRYIVIPRNRLDVDVVWTTLPESAELYRVKTSVASVDFLKGLYVVDFYWKLSVTRIGYAVPIYRAILGDEVRLVEIDVNSPLRSLKKIDRNAEYHIFKDLHEIDSNFLISLSRTIGTSTVLPMRFLSIQLATYIEDTDTPLIMNFREAYKWMKENPQKLRGLVILPSYYFGIIIADPITEKELKRDIVFEINVSTKLFELDYVTPQYYLYLQYYVHYDELPEADI